MRGIAFILIFLFLVIFIIPVSAETGSFVFSGSVGATDTTGTEIGSPTGSTVIYIMNPEVIGELNNIQTVVSGSWGGSSLESRWDTSVTYKHSGVTVGTGQIGFSKNEAGKRVVIAFFNDDFDVSGLGTSKITLNIEDWAYTSDLQTHDTGKMLDGDWRSPKDNTMAYIGRGSAGGVPGSLPGDVYVYNYYELEFPYTYVSTSSYFSFEMERDSSLQSMLYIENSGSVVLTNETSLQSSDFTLLNNDFDNNTWYVTLENIYGDTDTDTIIFDYVSTSAGTIELNQSSYTEPELIQIDAELTEYDFTNHIYRILMEYSIDDGANWERLSVAFNSTSVMSSTTECRTATIDSSYYTLPIKIRAVIDDYNKLTSSSSTIATSSEVYYNPPAAYDYIVSGTVFNADNGAVIEGALVSASGVTTTISTSTVTGKFQLYLSEGYYTITTSKSGYQDNVQTDLLIDHDVSWAQIHLTPIGYGNNTLYGNINDVDTGNAIQDVHVIITNATDQIDAYTSSGGYYEATGLAQSSTYTVRALRTGYRPYNGTVTTEATGASHKSFDMVQVNYSATPTPTVVSTYPGGEGHEWSNDEIVTMLRVLVPGIFMMMLIFLFIAVILGVTGGGGANGGQRGLGLDEIWKR